MRAPEPAGRALEPSERTLDSARRVSGLAGRALMRALEPAERALESAGGPLPKKEKKNFDNDNENQRKFCRSGVGYRNLANHGIIRCQSVLFFPLSFCLGLSISLYPSLLRVRTVTHASIWKRTRAYGNAHARADTHICIGTHLSLINQSTPRYNDYCVFDR